MNLLEMMKMFALMQRTTGRAASILLLIISSEYSIQ